MWYNSKRQQSLCRTGIGTNLIHGLFIQLAKNRFYTFKELLKRKKVYMTDHIGPAAATTAKLLQSCLTLCIPIDGSPPGSPVPGILQARTLEWVAISFSNTWTWKVKVKSLSRVWLFATTWTAAYQAPPPMGFSRQEYWSGVPLPSPLILHSSSFIHTPS